MLPRASTADLRVLYPGHIIGGVAFGAYADGAGRRPALICCVLCAGLGALGLSLAGSFTALLLSRLLSGFGAGGIGPTSATLVQESFPTAYRATAVIGLSVWFTAGLVFSAGLGALMLQQDKPPWRAYLAINALVCICVAPNFLMLVESPHWVSSNRPGRLLTVHHLVET